MKCLKNSSVIALFIASSLFAQGNRLTVGFVTSQLHNYKTDQQMSEIHNPLGTGLMLGYCLQNSVAFSAVGEYMKSNIKKSNLQQSDLRLTFQVHAFPYQWKNLRPYFSGGLVCLRHSTQSDIVQDEVNASFQLRESIGLDYQLSPYVSLNFDIAGYSDGLKFLGHANSFCIRYSL